MKSKISPLLIEHLVAEWPLESSPEIMETHISWILLDDQFAYKIKKPVNLGFLDFSDLAARKHFCMEELRLNRRLAPNLYLNVVPITGSLQHPQIDGHGNAIEYAVKMRKFDQSQRFDQLLEKGELTVHHIDLLASQIAKFHQLINTTTSAGLDYGRPAQVWESVAQNFTTIESFKPAPRLLSQLSRIQQWSRDFFERYRQTFSRRYQDGFIRECHGDLHLANIAHYEQQILPFDCLEFNPSLRWIDTISEIAFTIMDLLAYQQPGFAWRLLNGYLAQTGDFDGLKVLPFYLVYRAMVRAKIAAIRAAQMVQVQGDVHEMPEAFANYLLLAQSFTDESFPSLVIMSGISGSGKSTLAQTLCEHMGAIRIRSDVERKRLCGPRPEQGSASDPTQYYSEQMTQRTYSRLVDLCRRIHDAGFSVVVDATFLTQRQRRPFYEYACQDKLRFHIVWCDLERAVCEQRIRDRTGDVSDVTAEKLDVLDRQLQQVEPFDAQESQYVIQVDTRSQPVGEQINQVLAHFDVTD